MSRFRIGLTAQGGAAWMGGQEYIKNLASALHESGQADVVLFSGARLEPSWRAQMAVCTTEIHDGFLQGPDPFGKRIRYFFDRRILRLSNTRFGNAVRAAGVDFLYPLTYDNLYNVGVGFPVSGCLEQTRWAGWIPDFQHRHMPQLFDRTEILKRDRGIEALAREARTMVLSSAAAAADFQRFCPSSAARAEILHFCTSPASEWFSADPVAVQRRYSLPDAFFLISNQLWEHKNHLVVFGALELLAKRSLFPTVVCTGQPYDFRNKDYINVVLRRVHELGVAKQVCFLGLIPREDQIQLMRRSLAVIQPSLFEGWSTVVEDARLLGKPTILSDLAVHLEQAPPGAAYFTKNSPASLAEAISSALNRLSPGPVIADEERARGTAADRTQNFAQRFLEIARAA